jgi:hypothetical protein
MLQLRMLIPLRCRFGFEASAGQNTNTVQLCLTNTVKLCFTLQLDCQLCDQGVDNEHHMLIDSQDASLIALKTSY